MTTAVPLGEPGARVRAAPSAGRATIGLPWVAVCVLAAALRFITLGHQSFDFDESFTVGVVLGSSLSHALHTIPLTESSPPLYYVLAWLWSQVFGLGAFGIRALSALFGTALVAITPAIARRCGGSPRAGLLAATLMAVNPLMVWYSQEARAYALLALLSALSFWAFVAALERPERGPLLVWAGCSALALLCHYFAAFLILPEAAWLALRIPRRRAAVAIALPLAVGAALLPLALRQADHRTEWIEAMSLGSRIREVVKKWATGEIAPKATAVLLAAILLGVAACVFAWRRLDSAERRGAGLALGAAAAAVLMPLAVDLLGWHYLISKNVMPALTVGLLGVGLVLGGRRGGPVAIVAGGTLAVAFLALTVAGAIAPSMQRPDYRRAAAALGPPQSAQVIVAPRLGDHPISVYRQGALPMPAGFAARQVIVVRPLPRADASPSRGPTPAPPAGFTLRGRRDARSYTLICFTAPRPVASSPVTLRALAGGSGASAQVWPGAPAAAAPPAVCRP